MSTTVHIARDPLGETSTTVALAYEPEEGNPSRLVAAPMGETGIENLLPQFVAYKRGSSEVKNNRRRVLVEDSIPFCMEYDGITGLPNEASLKYMKIHTVLELPFTLPVKPSTGAAEQGRMTALNTLLRIHAMNLIPSLGTAGTGNTKIAGVGNAIDGTEAEYINSPFVRGSRGLSPFGVSTVLGTEVTGV